MAYDKRHGGPFDRGGADFWYGRPAAPHYYIGQTYSTRMVHEKFMTDEEVEAYRAGYAEAERFGDQKDWA